MNRSDRPHTKEIKMWLLTHDLTQAEVARRLGVALEEVNAWIWGRRNNAAVREWFKENGLPAEFIGEERWLNRHGEPERAVRRKKEAA